VLTKTVCASLICCLHSESAI